MTDRLNIKRQLRLLPLAVMATLLMSSVWSSCNTSGCTDNQNALPLAGFYSSQTGQAITVSDFDISGVGAPHDSVLYPAGIGRSEVYLPFRSNASETAYDFTYHVDSVTTVTDRISFSYTSEPYFASEECGAMFFYRIKSMSYTTNLIDSVKIIDSLVTNSDIQRIHIYFRTAQE